MILITCSACKKDKQESEFRPCKAKKNGLQSYCASCATIRRRLYKSERPPLEKERETQFKYRYGLTKPDFDLMWARQQGLCKICTNPLNLGLRGYSIDHNHQTGQVRGLLCNKCNTGLGLFNDNPVSLQNAITYLNECANESKTN